MTANKVALISGNGYPSIPHERLFREWEEFGYADDIKERIFHGNAERISPLPVEPRAWSAQSTAISRKERV